MFGSVGSGNGSGARADAGGRDAFREAQRSTVRMSRLRMAVACRPATKRRNLRQVTSRVGSDLRCRCPESVRCKVFVRQCMTG